jgi:trigger factor
MMHQTSHMLERQHLSMEQYLLIMRKSREEYMQELRPEAEKRVKRELVLDEVANREHIEVEAQEIEALFNAYAQIGQNLPRTEAGIRALALSYRREKTLSRLIELIAGPDPDAEGSGSVSEEAEEATVENAQAAAFAGEAAAQEAHTESEKAEEPAAVTPPSDARAAEKVE